MSFQMTSKQRAGKNVKKTKTYRIKDKDAVKDTDDKDKKETSQDEAAPSKTGKALQEAVRAKSLLPKREDYGIE